jgi:hypothetical protein
MLDRLRGLPLPAHPDSACVHLKQLSQE